MNNHIDKLKDTADALGIKYSPNIGAYKLQEKIDAMEQIDAEKKMLEKSPEPKVVVNTKPKEVSAKQISIMKAKNLLKVKVVNMDPQNRSATTAFSGVWNMVMGIQRVVPLGVTIALEACLVTELEERRYTSSEPEIDHMGQPTGNFLTVSAPVYQVIRF